MTMIVVNTALMNAETEVKTSIYSVRKLPAEEI